MSPKPSFQKKTFFFGVAMALLCYFLYKDYEMFKTNELFFTFCYEKFKKKRCKLRKLVLFCFRFLSVAVIVLNGCKIFIFSSNDYTNGQSSYQGYIFVVYQTPARCGHNEGIANRKISLKKKLYCHSILCSHRIPTKGLQKMAEKDSSAGLFYDRNEHNIQHSIHNIKD